MKLYDIAKHSAFAPTVCIYLHSNVMRIMKIEDALNRYGNCLVSRYGYDWFWIDTPNVT